MASRDDRRFSGSAGAGIHTGDQESLRRLSGETGIWNRRHFQIELSALIGALTVGVLLLIYSPSGAVSIGGTVIFGLILGGGLGAIAGLLRVIYEESQ